MTRWWWVILSLWVLLVFGYWALARAAARGDQQLRDLMNQPRDQKGKRQP